MKQEQQLLGKYISHYCPVHQRVTQFLLTEDTENHIICIEDNCGYRKILKELPPEKDIKKMSMKEF